MLTSRSMFSLYTFPQYSVLSFTFFGVFFSLSERAVIGVKSEQEGAQAATAPGGFRFKTEMLYECKKIKYPILMCFLSFVLEL